MTSKLISCSFFEDGIARCCGIASQLNSAERRDFIPVARIQHDDCSDECGNKYLYSKGKKKPFNYYYLQ